MNGTQLKYAREKINTIYYEKQREIEKKYKLPVLSDEEISERLKQGRFKVVDYKPKRYNNGYLRDFIIVEGMEKDEELKNQETQALKELANAKSKVMDELILGDADGALELLNSFANKEF